MITKHCSLIQKNQNTANSGSSVSSSQLQDYFLKIKKRKVIQLGPAVRKADNFIQRINFYSADKISAFLILIGQRANFYHVVVSVYFAKVNE